MRRLALVLAFIATVVAVRVPVDNVIVDSNKYNSTTSTQSPFNNSTSLQDETEYYEEENASDIDSYLVPPSPHRREKVDPEAPATYLVPPTPDSPSEFNVDNEEGEQSEWRPIPPEILPIQIPKKIKKGASKTVPSNSPLLPSRGLEPPKKYIEDFLRQDTSEVRIKVPSTELETPRVDATNDFNTDTTPSNSRFGPVEPARSLALRLKPPTHKSEPKYPTRLFPKKYITQGFNPIPIPIVSYEAALSHRELPKGKRLKVYRPLLNAENIIYMPYEHKKIQKFEQIDQKTQEDTAVKKQPVPTEDTSQADDSSPEQEVSETNYRHTGLTNNHVGRFITTTTTRAPASEKLEIAPPPPKERTEFRMHGMKGPHSYQFGYDTGKGKNRQFRFEERDNEGRVRGHYGYMDRSGKLRVFNYNADPDTGFHAEPQEDTEPQAAPSSENTT